MSHVKEAYYFSHDSNARNDPKISALINDFGMEGYGIFWAIVEILSEQENYKLKKFNKLYSGLSRQLLLEENKLRSIIEAMLHDYELLLQDENFIWSASLLRRMNIREAKRQAKVEAGRLGGIKSGKVRAMRSNAEAKAKQNEAPLEANEPKESKVKESTNKRSSSSKIFADDSKEFLLAAKLKKLILQNNPKSRTPDNLQNWAHEIDLMIRIDKRTPEEIEAMIDFSQKDSFWSANILSVGTLRKQFDKLYLRSKQKEKSSPYPREILR